MGIADIPNQNSQLNHELVPCTNLTDSKSILYSPLSNEISSDDIYTLQYLYGINTSLQNTYPLYRYFLNTASSVFVYAHFYTTKRGEVNDRCPYFENYYIGVTCRLGNCTHAGQPGVVPVYRYVNSVTKKSKLSTTKITNPAFVDETLLGYGYTNDGGNHGKSLITYKNSYTGDFFYSIDGENPPNTGGWYTIGRLCYVFPK